MLDDRASKRRPPAMQLLGKILVVAVLVMSLMFMTLAAITYGTHRDLKTAASERQTERREAQDRVDSLLEQYRRVAGELRQQRISQREQLRKLEAERLRLLERDRSLRDQLEQLAQQRQAANRDVAQIQRTNTDLIRANHAIRSQIDENQAATERAFDGVITAVEAVNQLHGEVESLGERNADLVLQNRQLSGAR